MSNEIDLLMNEDPLQLSEQDIDAIIKYERAMRMQHELGVKPKKEKGGVSLENVLANLTTNVIAPPPQTFKRRI